MDKELLHDTRLVKRWIAKGMLTEDDLAGWLAKLPDSSENAENIELSAVDHVEISTGKR